MPEVETEKQPVPAPFRQYCHGVMTGAGSSPVRLREGHVSEADRRAACPVNGFARLPGIKGDRVPAAGCYSRRRVATGSTRVLRQAGAQTAATATRARKSGAATKVIGSIAATPKSWLR